MEKRILFATTVVAALAVGVSWGVAAKDENAPAQTPAKTEEATPEKPAIPLELAGIHNVFLLGKSIYSGSCPEGEAGFRSLANIGIKTIITVDGAKPVMEWAKKYGMRYVHIPIAYGGVSRKQQLEISRAVRDLPGPVFIHCHHGKHRGPTAAVIAAMVNEGWTIDQATAAMAQAGTSTGYSGLWKAAREFQMPTKAELDKADNTFPNAVAIAPVAEAMVTIDERFANIGDVRAADWGVPANHPDIDPPHEALLLTEDFRELKRSPEVAKYPENYMTMLDDAEKASQELEAALRNKDKVKAQEAYVKINQSCNSCHVAYRNKKLPE